MLEADEVKKQSLALIKKGRIIEAGFVMLLLRDAPSNAPPEEVAAVRHVFFLGAKFLLEALRMPPPTDVTPEDLTDILLAELKKFLDDNHPGTRH